MVRQLAANILRQASRDSLESETRKDIENYYYNVAQCACLYRIPAVSRAKVGETGRGRRPLHFVEPEAVPPKQTHQLLVRKKSAKIRSVRNAAFNAATVICGIVCPIMDRAFNRFSPSN
ncbi:unnamed protein product [Bursaphelenchus xylophilus]|uniref:(pine wood nematode) hypothetical protein n=1 Tax=Bursaphelenchus xylophilus TaxID=6326 RepID=A0A1I7RMD9_BURXY|nr:unnamed protein product [Bursaphelenchus xylophilus]CAG9118406.1 unnamed protein product [Bursaphelenchus xylophilus]